MRVYVRLYRSHILVARVTLSSRFPRGGETAGASSALTLPAWWRKRKIDARGGPQWSPLVRDRLAFPCFLPCLSCPVPESLEACGLCLCFAWTHDARSFHAEQRPVCTALARCSCACVWAIFSQLAAPFSCTRPYSPPAVHSIIRYLLVSPHLALARANRR